MKFPQRPPGLQEVLLLPQATLASLLDFSRAGSADSDYVHWDKLRRRPLPPGINNHREWWFALKLARKGKAIPLTDTRGRLFQFGVPELVLAELHQIDLGSGGLVSLPEPITNPETRDRYIISSLMEEAITSSQLEGAATTREVAKAMLRSGRKPRDIDEQMILNNFLTMQHIRTLKQTPLSPELVLQIHAQVTNGTLEDPSSAGRLRKPAEKIVIGDDYGNVFHEPPNADELTRRLEAMCAFANKATPDFFVHPVVRAIFLHFWLAYDHPFVDGNGRTARALFYWSMLHSGYWLFEFVSISTILRKAPVQYRRSFLYTGTDDNDLTYFLIAQTKVIRAAIHELHAYITRKTAEVKAIEANTRALDLFNHRQVSLIRHVLAHPGQRYTIAGHRMSHDVSYQTARTDLLELAELGVLTQQTSGKKLVFSAAGDLPSQLTKLEARLPVQKP